MNMWFGISSRFVTVTSGLQNRTEARSLDCHLQVVTCSNRLSEYLRKGASYTDKFNAATLGTYWPLPRCKSRFVLHVN